MTARRWLAVAAGLILWAALPHLLSGRVSLAVAVFIALHALIAIGLTVLAGQAGQVSLGQATFYGVGAYVSAILSLRLGVNPWLALAAAPVAAAALAYAVGLPVLQLRGHHLVLATLGLNIIFEVLFRELSITGGANGLSGIPALQAFGARLQGDVTFYYLASVATALAAWLASNLVRSRVGRGLAAIRCSEVMAESLGIDPAAYKSQVFAFSAALAGLAGSLYAYYLRFVSPSAFTFGFSIELLVMAVVGGIGSVPGAVAGAAVLTVLREALRTVMPRLMGLASGEYETVFFGALLAAVVILFPEGLWPRLLRLRGAKPVADQPPAPWVPAGGETPALVDGRPEPAFNGASREAAAGPKGGPVLQVEGVSHHFGGLVALSDVGFEVRHGEIYAIIGPNGAGKTTLFNLISGLLRAAKGRIRYLQPSESDGGITLNGMRACAISRRGVGRTFQTPRLVLEATALENVQMGLHPLLRGGFLRCLLGLNRKEEHWAEQEALRLLRLVGVERWARTPVASLPFGVQRLVEMARALAGRPRILLVDEPASGLTASEREWLGKLLRSLGIAVLLVEHDVRLVSSVADRVLVLHYGKVVAEGSPEEIRRNRAVQAAYLGDEVNSPDRFASR
mgnify:CR=1 FL=1